MLVWPWYDFAVTGRPERQQIPGPFQPGNRAYGNAQAGL